MRHSFNLWQNSLCAEMWLIVSLCKWITPSKYERSALAAEVITGNAGRLCRWRGGPRQLPTHCPPPHRGPPRRGVTLTVHSWQSVSSPPTTMRYLRCGEQGLCWLQLKPSSSSRRTCRLWSFFFQRAQMLTLLYAWETLQPPLARKKKNIKVLSACYIYRRIQIQIKRLSGIKNQSIVDFY